jgi:general secretion pathway protein K
LNRKPPIHVYAYGTRSHRGAVQIRTGAASVSGSRGMALVIVLWVLTLLSVLALEFCYSMRTELNVTRHYKEETQLYFYAQGGVQRAITEMIYKNDPEIQSKKAQGEAQQNLGIRKEEAEVLPPIEEWHTDGRPYPVAFRSGEASVSVMSEAGKINLNRASDQLLKQVIKYFVEMGEKRDVIADSIQDWRDKDDLHRINGAENDYYQSLPEPYNCKNGDFDTVEELLLVRGITPELFYGKKTKKEGEEEAVNFGLKDIFTVFSSAAQVDINSAPREVLRALFGIPPEMADRVIGAREEREFRNVNELRQAVPDITPYIQNTSFLTFRSNVPYYTITSWGKLSTGESRRGVECVVRIDRKEESGYKILMWKDMLY